MRVLRLPTATAGRKTSAANTLGTWKHTIVFAYKAILYGRRSEWPERRSAGYRMERPAKDRRRTGLKTSRHRASGDAAGRPVPLNPDSRPMPTGDWHGIQNGFSKQGPGKSPTYGKQPFPGPYFHAVNRVHTFGKVSSRSSSAIPISSPNSQSLSRAQRTTTAVREAATGDASDRPGAACSAPS